MKAAGQATAQPEARSANGARFRQCSYSVPQCVLRLMLCYGILTSNNELTTIVVIIVIILLTPVTVIQTRMSMNVINYWTSVRSCLAETTLSTTCSKLFKYHRSLHYTWLLSVSSFFSNGNRSYNFLNKYCRRRSCKE